jgi:hypothetical protein
MLDESVLEETVKRAFVKRFGEGVLQGMYLSSHTQEYWIRLYVPEITDDIRRFCAEMSDYFLAQGIPAGVNCWAVGKQRIFSV